MSRKARRVPLDFDWPVEEIWSGYLRPNELDLPTCTDCDGSGSGPLARYLDRTFYANDLPLGLSRLYRWDDKITQDEVDMLVAAHRLDGWGLFDRVEVVPPRVDEDGDEVRYDWVRNDVPTPTADEVNAAQRGRAMVHDAINRWKLVRRRCEQMGGVVECLTCAGRGEVGTDEQRAAHEAWELIDPPTGDGWQLWETTTEGSPKSPVFATGEELAQWMSRNPCGFAGAVIPLETARRWVEGSGWSPSMAFSPEKGLQDGITFVAGSDGDS